MRVFICDIYWKIRDKTKLLRESPSRPKISRELIFTIVCRSFCRNPWQKSPIVQFSRNDGIYGMTSKISRSLPATLYDLLNARSDPTRSRGYIICNGPYIRQSRLVFSSLKLGCESHSHDNPDRGMGAKVKTRHWAGVREIEKSYVPAWPPVWPEMIHTRGTTAEPALSADSASFPEHSYIRYL